MTLNERLAQINNEKDYCIQEVKGFLYKKITTIKDLEALQEALDAQAVNFAALVDDIQEILDELYN